MLHNDKMKFNSNDNSQLSLSFVANFELNLSLNND